MMTDHVSFFLQALTGLKWLVTILVFLKLIPNTPFTKVLAKGVFLVLTTFTDINRTGWAVYD